MTSVVRRTVAALVVAAAAGCDRSGAPSAPDAPPPVRLLEHLTETELTNGGAAGEFFGRRAAPVSSDEGGLIAAVSAPRSEGYDQRAALVMAPDSRLVWKRHVDRAYELHVALLPLAAREGAPAKARFRVAAGPASGPLGKIAELELDRAVTAGWHELRVALPARGFDRLELAIEGTSAGAWAAPELVPVGHAGHRRTNLILISLDTLRADRLGAYGYSGHPTSPNIDRLAARAVRFETAISQAPWTRPSHRAMLTGVYPASSGGLERRFLAEELWRAGFTTAGLTSGGQVDVAFGFDRGFERYAVEMNWVREPEKAMDMIDADPARPFFLFLHTYEIHDPYEDARFLPPGDCPQFPRQFGSPQYRRIRGRATPKETRCVGALYDGDIAFTDEKVGRILARLEASGRMEDTIVVVTSDHGEQMWEHGLWRHGLTVYEEELRVPLIVYLPDSARERFVSSAPGRRRGAVIESTVALVDLAPSLYELLEIPVEHRMHGRSFVPLLRGQTDEPREILSESARSKTIELKSLRTDRFKFIARFSKKSLLPLQRKPYALFELRRDPGEQRDLVARYPDAVKALALRLDALTEGKLGELDQNSPDGIDEALRKQLEALGYLGDN